MAHFCKLNSDNIVQDVVVVSNDIATTEQAGVDFLNNLYGTNDVWKQTSYNTYANVHTLGGTPFRKNYGSIGFTYNETIDGFVAPKTYDSWVLNETKGVWEPPVAYPNDGNEYDWNENTQNWVLKE
jgi:hypothetical protein|tara:strand:- start:201 stop:578 length:378 start_codon:yes stop_codon:yes gene_type:complete